MAFWISAARLGSSLAPAIHAPENSIGVCNHAATCQNISKTFRRLIDASMMIAKKGLRGGAAGGIDGAFALGLWGGLFFGA